MNNNISFETYLQEAHEYFNELSRELGHPEEKQRVIMLWKAVMHSIRERIEMSESLDLISQMPMLLKALYVEQWKYHDKPSLDYTTLEEMKDCVKSYQKRYGEMDFNWNIATEELISRLIESMKKYWTEGQLDHLREQLPQQVKELVH